MPSIEQNTTVLPNKVNLFILGAQKCGTTALATFLNEHPDICLVEGKEAHVFDDPDYPYSGTFDEKINFATQKYASLLDTYGNERYICDATPITMLHSIFVTECYSYNPDGKFIIILRDPVERAISQYKMEFLRNNEHRSMLTAFLGEPFRLALFNKQPPWGPNSPFRVHNYLHRGLYKKQLAHVKATVPAKQLLIINNGQLRNEHDATLRKIFNFLSISDIRIEQRKVFTSKNYKPNPTDRLARFIAKLFFVLRG